MEGAKFRGFNGAERSDLWRWAEHVRAEDQKGSSEGEAASLFSAGATTSPKTALKPSSRKAP